MGEIINIGTIDGEEFKFSSWKDRISIWRIGFKYCVHNDEIDCGNIWLDIGNDIQEELAAHLSQYKKALEKAKKLMVLL